LDPADAAQYAQVVLSDLKDADTDKDQDDLIEHMTKLNFSVLNSRFFGASSSFMLIKDTRVAKNTFTGQTQIGFARRPPYWQTYPVRIITIALALLRV
jgi:hypothetical protein